MSALRDQLYGFAAHLRDPAAHPPEQVDRLATGQRRPQGDIAWHIGNIAVQRDGVDPRVAAEQSGRAFIGADQAQQRADGGRLPCAVGPQEAVHLAAGDGQIESVESPGCAEMLDESVYFDGVLRHH